MQYFEHFSVLILLMVVYDDGGDAILMLLIYKALCQGRGREVG